MPPGAGSVPSARKIFFCSGSARVALRTCKVRPSLRLKVAVTAVAQSLGYRGQDAALCGDRRPARGDHSGRGPDQGGQPGSGGRASDSRFRGRDGDRRHRRTADAIAAEAGIDSVLAEVLPDQKADEIKRLQSSGRRSHSSAMASTTPRRWRRPMPESPSARAPTSPSRRAT